MITKIVRKSQPEGMSLTTRLGPLQSGLGTTIVRALRKHTAAGSLCLGLEYEVSTITDHVLSNWILFCYVKKIGGFNAYLFPYIKRLDFCLFLYSVKVRRSEFLVMTRITKQNEESTGKQSSKSSFATSSF